MREIKFRGKAKNRNNKWIYGNYRHYDGITWIFPEDEEAAYDAHQVHPDTVGQYTGLKDKNGVEIYEGDIVEDGWGQKSPIIFRDGRFIAESHYPDEIYDEESIICGNIYEEK